jgi:hypothetical protein
VAEYRRKVLEHSPSAYFRLGEVTGGAMNEVGGTGAAAPPLGTYNVATIRRGQSTVIAHTADRAVQLNGTSEYVSIPDNANVDLGDVFTIEMWHRRSVLGTVQTLVDKGTGAYRLSFAADNKLTLTKAGTGDVVKSASGITGTGWLHLVATKNGATSKLYVNGVDVTGVVTNQTLTNNATTLYLGAQGGSSVFLTGPLDEFAVYKRALTQAEVLQHYRAAMTVDIWPELVLEMALDSNPLDSTYVWRNYSEFATSYDTTPWRQQELDRIESRTAGVTLLNLNSEWDCENTASPYNGTLLPMKPLRISLDFYGTRYPLYVGYIEEFPPTEAPGPYSAVSLTASDGMALLAQASFPDPGPPSLMATWDNGTLITTDGVGFTAPDYARTVWVQVLSNWYAEDAVLRFHYTNQDGAGDYGWSFRLASTNIPQSALASTGTRFPLELLDGDYGVRDVLTSGTITSVTGEGRVGFYGQKETFPKLTSGFMVAAILDSIGWPTGVRVLDPGASLMQGFTPEPEESPLARIQGFADAELGFFFFSQSGDVTIQDRHHRWRLQNAIKAVYGDGTASSELPYVELQREGKAVKRVRNDAIITMDGATTPGRSTNTASVTAYGRKQFSATVPIATPREATQMAQQIVNWYAQPATRITSLSVVPDGGTKNKLKLQKTLALNFGDRVQVIRRPPGGSKITKTARVEGISVSGSANPKALKITLQLSPDVTEPGY